MRFHGLDLNLLVALDALLTELSVSRAAERVFVSQPAMSNSLSRLREFFGDELIVRSGKHMLLTPRAEALVDPLRDILLQIDSRLVSPPTFDPLKADDLFTLCVSDYITSVLIQPLLQRLAKTAPLLRFKLVTLEPAESLGRGDIDLLITPVHFTSPLHPKLKLLEEDYVCVTWRDSTRFGETPDLAAYQAAGHVAVSFAGGRTPGLDSALLLESGVERRVEVVAGSLLAPAELVIGTDRVATVQRRLARRVAQYLPLRLWEVPCKLPLLVEYMQWNRVREADPALKWLISQCLEVAAAV
jgi:LysR family nod box-dependent transcriptional activator